MKTKKILIFAFVCIFFIVLFPKAVFAGEQELENLDFEVYLTEEGNMKVVETWEVYIYDTNTLFKTIPIDDSHDGITDVTVSRIKDNGTIIDYTKSDKYQYHVDEECYQALKNPDGDFEIAWGVNETGSSTRTYKISYTVLNNITLYNDCAELYWKFVGDNFEIYSENVTGKIYLPTKVQNEDDLKVWAHGPLNGDIQRENGDTVTFSVENLYGGTFLEVRVTTPTEIFSLSNNKVSQDKLNDIITEETLWAEEANIQREKKARQEAIASFIIAVIEIIAIVYLLRRIIKNSNEISKSKKLEPTEKPEYFRDFPDESASAVEAGFLYYYMNGDVLYDVTAKMLSGTMLNLSLKGWIAFEQNDKKIVTVELKDNGKQELNEDENLIYDFLKEVSGDDNKFTMKEFEKYCKSSTKNSNKFMKLLEKIPEVVKKESETKGKYDNKLKKKYDSIVSTAVVEFVIVSFLSIIGFVLSNILITGLLVIVLIINTVISVIFSRRFTGLTQKGVDEKEQWKALKRYMENFSMLDEREVPDLILWEKYLVFATTFGIADKVIKQLKVKFPELQDEEYMRNNFTYMYFVCNSNNNSNFIKSIDSSIGNVTNYSSGGGSGGGFSGGGGGRWPEVVAVEVARISI